MNLGGALTWSIETDDFRGFCHGTPFILTKTIVDSMNGPTNLMPNNPCQSGIVDPPVTPSTTASPQTTRSSTAAPIGPVTSTTTRNPPDSGTTQPNLCAPTSTTVY